MVRTLFLICMSWMILLNSMVYSVICVNFQLNRSFITEMFCENKGLPLSSCGGACYMERQLEHASQESEGDVMRFRSDFNAYTLACLPVFSMKREGKGVPTQKAFYQFPFYGLVSMPLEKPPKC
ncbi:hypothetical protein A3SI_16622 [Nitritalea halalkaliphila LW7]|uniref:Uncharacterized protein n=1 Tax=Nitritalea halalkaliphila LW7 TaxID=1189621 RepID=I5BWY9_9BACT|nr:hypothetical protein [Nitritalea halalkaliphila]EIM74091.1 hypothetical protein A3SI_16622 [Nitritalea halalkaliphila LW7]